MLVDPTTVVSVAGVTFTARAANVVAALNGGPNTIGAATMSRSMTLMTDVRAKCAELYRRALVVVRSRNGTARR